jgi:uncharacterized protein YdhG (YjbR/CyaY superfamily)
MEKRVFKTIDEYHAEFPQEVRNQLDTLRKTIAKAAPKAQEVISYNMPAFKQHGILVYYAAAKKHIGFYPTAWPIVAFKKELEGYQTSKGAIQFPLDQKLPLALITKIVKFRVTEDLEKEKLKKEKKKK